MSPQSITHYNASVRGVAASEALALYGRVSGDEQEKQATIDSQLSEMRAAVAARGGHIVEEYLDNPYTGTVAHRPALDRLMKDAGKTFTHLLIHAPDRLARGKPYLRAMLEDELRSKGVTFAYLNYEVEDSPEGRAKDGMTSVFAEWEREKIMERTRRGMREKRLNGHIWRAASDRGRPYGWRYIKAPEGEKHGRLEHHPEEAPIVAWMFAQVLDGWSAHRLTVELNRRGLRTTMGNTWSRSTVLRVLHNPIHTGRVPDTRYQVRPPAVPQSTYRKRQKSVAVERPREDWTLIALAAGGLVSQETFDQVQARLRGNKRRTSRQNKASYPLSLLCTCMAPRRDDPSRICGATLTGYQRTKGDLRVYRCHRTYYTADVSGDCKNRIAADALEAWVWQQVKNVIHHPEELFAELAERERNADSRRADCRREIVAARAALDAAQQRLDKLVLRNAAGAIDDETFDRLQPTLVLERDQARERVQEAEHALQQVQDSPTSRLGDITAFCRALSDRLDEIERPGHEAEREALIRALVVRIEVGDIESQANPPTKRPLTRKAVKRVRLEGLLPAISAVGEVSMPACPDWRRYEWSVCDRPPLRWSARCTVARRSRR